MIYFAAVSYAEAWQRLCEGGDETAPWSGFLGVGDPVLEPLPRESITKLRRLKSVEHPAGAPDKRQRYVEWVREAIAPRNVAGLANPERGNLYPVDLDALIEQHDVLNMTREQVIEALPKLRGA
jgi:hypothetical protein